MRNGSRRGLERSDLVQGVRCAFREAAR